MLSKYRRVSHCLFTMAMAAVLAAAVLFSAGSPAPAYADSSQGSVKRIIDVVYDDSASMDTSSEWAQAHYALEAIVGMMGPEDELNVYPMSGGDNPKPSVSITPSASDNQESVDQIHQVFSQKPGGTAFSPAQQAYAHLKNIASGDDVRKYLIVLTDGEFTSVDGMSTKNDGSEAVSAKVNEYLTTWANESDIEIHYVIMGDEDVPLPQASSNLIISNTASRGIMYGIVDVCNEVYGQSSLPDTSFVNDTLTIPIPTKRIVVFAQGEDVSVDYAEIDGDRQFPTSVSLKYADKPHQSKNGTWEKNGCQNDESLQGIMATFEPSEAEGFNAGEMILSMANAEEIEIYYEPYVNVEVTLVDESVSDSDLPWPISRLLSVGDTVIDSSNTDVRLTKGTYYVSSRMLNPLTGEEIKPEDSQNLIHSLSLEASLAYDDGEVVDLYDDKKVVLKDGEGSLRTTATVYASEHDPDPTVVSQRMDVVVDPANFATIVARYGLILLILALLVALIWVVYLHRRAPRLPKGLDPKLKDKHNPAANRTLKVEPRHPNKPFFRAETQEFYMVLPRNYESRVMPRSVRLRAVKGGMVIDNWAELVAAANRDNVAAGAIKVGNKDLKRVKQGEECPKIGPGSRITFTARRGGTETKMELKFS